MVCQSMTQSFGKGPHISDEICIKDLADYKHHAKRVANEMIDIQTTAVNNNLAPNFTRIKHIFQGKDVQANHRRIFIVEACVITMAVLLNFAIFLDKSAYVRQGGLPCYSQRDIFVLTRSTTILSSFIVYAVALLVFMYTVAVSKLFCNAW